MKLKTLVIGSGPSAWAVLNSISNLEDVHLIDGGSSVRVDSAKITKHLGLKDKFGSIHAVASADDFGIVDESEDALPASLSRGGLSEIWGNGFTPYQFSQIDNSGIISDKVLTKTMAETLELIPHSNLNLNSNFISRFNLVELISEGNLEENLPIHPVFDKILSKTKTSNSPSNILIDRPFFLLNSESCTRCGLCLTGCPYGSLFDSGESINRMVLQKKLPRKNIYSGIVTRIIPSNDFVKVLFTSDANETQELIFDRIIISAGTLATAILLMKSDLIPNQLKIPDCQVFYFGLISRKRITRRENLPDLAQLVILPGDTSKGDFQISLYKPSETSRKRISFSIFSDFSKFFKIPRLLSDFIVPAIGFLPQEKSGFLVLEKINGTIVLRRVPNPESVREINSILRQIQPLTKKMAFFLSRYTVKIPDPGSGFHLGASLPLGGDVIDLQGRLRSEPKISIMDPSILPSLPAGAHTFVSMSLIRHIMKSRP